MRQLHDPLLPHGLSGRAERLEDLEDRVDLGIAREERGARGHLGEDAANAPEVHGHAVQRDPQEDLRRPVPERDDLRSILGH